jgi:hypothetical protein
LKRKENNIMASDAPWSNFSPSDYSPQQWARACLIDTEDGDKDSKDRYKLPVREPSGAVNRNGVHAAAARFGQLQGVPPEKRAAAAKKLITLYRSDLGETPPDSLMNHAGEGDGERSAPEVERLWTSNWQGYKNGSPLEVRSATNGNSKGPRIIGGYAAVFNTRSMPLQNFVEIVEPSFFNRSRSDDWPGVVCRFDHNNMMLLGTTASGTLRLSPDNIGLDYTVDLPECRGDVYEYVQRRDVRNSSFAFQVYDDDFTYDEGYPVRHLISGRLIDVAPVTIPAYPDATVGLRRLASQTGEPIEDVVKLAEHGELRSLFVRTDNRGPARPSKAKNGRQAQMEILAMRAKDPVGSEKG